MGDIFSKKKRSEIMSKIRSKWTKHEKLAHNYLKGRKVRHKMHPELPGKPDILFIGTNNLAFLHGCFWHGCATCCKKPEDNKKYWEWKVKYNKERDRKNQVQLKKMGYNVYTFWEHEFSKKNFDKTINKLINLTK